MLDQSYHYVIKLSALCECKSGTTRGEAPTLHPVADLGLIRAFDGLSDLATCLPQHRDVPDCSCCLAAAGWTKTASVVSTTELDSGCCLTPAALVFGFTSRDFCPVDTGLDDHASHLRFLPWPQEDCDLLAAFLVH